ncbi:hypothetical protein KCU71_g262, partial [Aureobasidium melanogenum]
MLSSGDDSSHRKAHRCRLSTLPPVNREFYDFYRTSRGEFTPSGSAPGVTTGRTITSNLKFMNFYPFNDIESISLRPMLFISGDIARSREISANAYARAAEPKTSSGFQVLDMLICTIV